MQIIGGTVGDTIKLVNNGLIVGAGGDGGGLYALSGASGSFKGPTKGNTALSFITPGITLVIENNGYIAGGGGGGVHNGTGGTGGTGGGGSENVVGTNGTGGGGGAARNGSGAGRKGGSGVVIIRYLTLPTTISSSIEFIRGTAADANRDYKLGNYNSEFKMMVPSARGINSKS
jgi:hypothetical protein